MVQNDCLKRAIRDARALGKLPDAVLDRVAWHLSKASYELHRAREFAVQVAAQLKRYQERALPVHPRKCPMCDLPLFHGDDFWQAHWDQIRHLENHGFFQQSTVMTAFSWGRKHWNGRKQERASSWWKCCCGKNLRRADLVKHVLEDFAHHRAILHMRQTVALGGSTNVSVSGPF